MRAVSSHSPLRSDRSNLRLNYFVVDGDDNLWRISASAFDRLWHDSSAVSELESDGVPVRVGDELRLLTVLSDSNWQPIVTFLLRARVRNDRLLVADRYHLYRTLAGHGDGSVESELVKYHLSGWPIDWQRQVAVAMDVPASQFKRVSIGGPVVMADLWGMPLTNVMSHFEKSLNKLLSPS